MKTLHLFSVAIIVCLFMACGASAKVSTASAVTAEEETFVEEDAMGDVLFQNGQDSPPKYGETPEDSIYCVRNLSLYQEYWNQGNRQLAYEPWREVLFHCPQASQNTFIRGRTLILMKYNEETDPLRRDAWVDTLMWVYDQRIKYFGHSPHSREGIVLGRKASDLYQLRPNNTLEIYELSKKSIELEGLESQADVLLVHMQSLIKLVEAGLRETDEILTTYDRIMEIVDHNLANNPSDARFFEPAKTNLEIMFEPFATCENIITLYGPRFEKDPENIDLLEKVTSMLNKSGCTDSDLYYNATMNLHRLKPTAESAFLMGRMESTRENFNEALDYFSQAVELYEDSEDKFTALMLMADISFSKLRQYREARSYALQAAELDPENGRPYIIIGEMYAATASQCGDDDLTKKVAYWAAVDKFVQARSIDEDPVVQERANQLINTWSQYFPNNELIFFHGLSEGETYRVECWINETTRVRARPR